MAIFTGIGTVLSRGAGTNPVPVPGSDTFNAVGQVLEISGPNVSKERVEVTSLDSVSGFKDYLSGSKDAGELQITLAWDPANAQHQGIIADAKASTAASQRNWRIVWADSGSYQVDFKGEVISAERSTRPNEAVTLSVTIAISGDVTETP